jgi:hypothetical protein
VHDTHNASLFLLRFGFLFVYLVLWTGSANEHMILKRPDAPLQTTRRDLPPAPAQAARMTDKPPTRNMAARLDGA